MRIATRLLSERRAIYLFDLLRSLVDREIKLLYKRSILGIGWTLISPLLQLLVFAFVFQVVLPVQIPHYASFTFIGLLAWNWFQNSLFNATGVIIASRSLIRQPGFPSPILPIVSTTTGLVHFVLALPILTLFLLTDGIKLTPAILFLPLIQALQFLFTVNLAYLLAAWNVTFRDVQHTLGVVLQLLFYLTPIFYDENAVPERYQLLYGLNPMVHIISAYRAVLMAGTIPHWQPIFVLAAAMLVAFPIGLFFFNKQSSRFVEEL